MDIEENIVDNFKYAKISITSANVIVGGKNIKINNKKLPYSCLKILFRTEECNSPTLYYQYDNYVLLFQLFLFFP